MGPFQTQRGSLMKRFLRWLALAAAIAIGVASFAPAALHASDHADPMILTEPYANITGLFFFPKDDQMILVFNVRRALRKGKPYELTAYDYVVHMDLHTP